MENTINIPRSLLVARPSVLAIYAALASVDDEGTGLRYVSYGELGGMVGLSRRTAARAVVALEAAGYVKREERGQWGIYIRILGDVAAKGDAPKDGTSEEECKTLIDGELRDGTPKDGTSENGSKNERKERSKEIESKEKISLSSGRAQMPACEKETSDESRSMSQLCQQEPFVPFPKSWEEVQAAGNAQGRVWTEQMARAFLDHYAALGWRTNAGVIMDWRRKLTKWAMCEAQYGGGTNGGTYYGARRGAMNLDRSVPGF